jgi:hypothetical protein
MMTTCGLHHACASRVRAGLAVLAGIILVALALGWWVYTPGDAEVAPLQTLIFMHRGDLPVPAQPGG